MSGLIWSNLQKVITVAKSRWYVQAMSSREEENGNGEDHTVCSFSICTLSFDILFFDLHWRSNLIPSTQEGAVKDKNGEVIRRKYGEKIQYLEDTISDMKTVSMSCIITSCFMSESSAFWRLQVTCRRLVLSPFSQQKIEDLEAALGNTKMVRSVTCFCLGVPTSEMIFKFSFLPCCAFFIIQAGSWRAVAGPRRFENLKHVSSVRLPSE